MKCESFVNGHCCCFDCPNIRYDECQEWYGIPASDMGLERIDCKDCMYADESCSCDDCYLQKTHYCPKTVDSWVNSVG